MDAVSKAANCYNVAYFIFEVKQKDVLSQQKLDKRLQKEICHLFNGMSTWNERVRRGRKSDSKKKEEEK